MTRESNVRERFCATVSTQPRSFARRDVWTRTRAPTSGKRHTDDDGKRHPLTRPREDAEDVRCEKIFHPLAIPRLYVEKSERDFLWRRVRGILYMENMTGRYRYRYLVDWC